jgi:hypothetical protein
MKKFIVFISILIFVLSVNVYPQEKVGQAGCGFLDVATGARACGMGEAFTVLGQDALALFYNPSGIGEIDANFDLSAGGTQWIADINYLYLAAAFNAGVWGNFGFSLISPDYGEIYGTLVDSLDPQGWVDIGLVDVSAFCAGVAYAREFTDKFTVGLQAKYVTQHLGENQFLSDEVAGVIDTVGNDLSTVAYDFGLLFYPGFTGFKSFAFGMSVRNFAPYVTYERVSFELPLTFTLGIGMDILELFGDYPDYSFNIGADMSHPRDWEEQYRIGGELSFRDMFFLRVGYKINCYAEGLNAGVGISMTGVKIDYSYSKHELYDMVNRASIGFSF